MRDGVDIRGERGVQLADIDAAHFFHSSEYDYLYRSYDQLEAQSVTLSSLRLLHQTMASSAFLCLSN